MMNDPMLILPTKAPKDVKDSGLLIRAYGLMMLGFPLSFIPFIPVSGLGFLLTIIGVIYVYRLKRRLKETELGRNHTQWMLRSFWMSSLYWILGATVAWAVVSANADTSAILKMNDALQSGNATPDDITAYIQEFQITNGALMIWSKVISFAPCIIFFVLRFVKGYRRAENDQLIENVKTWGI